MKIKKLQHDLMIRLVIVLGILVVALGATYYLRLKVHQLEDKYHWYKSDTLAIAKKLETLNKRTLEFSDSVRVWESMTESQKKLQGLQLSKARTLLEELQNKLKLSEVNISFSKPEEVLDLTTPAISSTQSGAKAVPGQAVVSTGLEKDGQMKVVTSDVSITFKALSDEFVYDFIYALEHDFPGYVQIKNFTVNREGKITKDIIERIANGDSPAIVAVTVDFVWKDLHYTPADKIQNDTAVPAASSALPKKEGGV